MKKRVLVIRKFDEFSRILAENNFEIVNLPLIKTSVIDDLSDFEAKLAGIENYDGIFITSQNAARILADEMRETHSEFIGKVYALGKRSFEILRDENLNLVFDESANTAREMLEKIASEDLKGQRFLFVRGEKSLREVPEFLTGLAEVDEVIVYETREIALESEKINEIREKIGSGKIVAACFFSPSAAENFIKHFSAEITHQTIIAAIGKTTADCFERRNIRINFVSSKATAEDFAVELVEYLGRNLTTDAHR